MSGAAISTIVEERVQAAIDEVLYDKKFFKKFDCVQQ